MILFCSMVWVKIGYGDNNLFLVFLFCFVGLAWLFMPLNKLLLLFLSSVSTSSRLVSTRPVSSLLLCGFCFCFF